MINEVLGAPGDFSVTIGPRLPANVEDSIQAAADRWPATFTVITPRMTTDRITWPELMDRAIYTGINQEPEADYDGAITLAGSNLLSWFGNKDDTAGPIPALDLTGTVDLEDSFSTWGDLNGLTPLLVGPDPASPNPPKWVWFPWFGSVRRQLEGMAPTRTDDGIEVFSTAQGDILVGTTIGQTTPRVMCTPGAVDDLGGLYGLDCTFRRRWTGDYITEARTQVEGGGNTEYSEYQADIPKGFGGTVDLQIAVTQPTGGDAANEAEARDQANAKVAECSVQREILGRARWRPDLREILSPGDQVWCYDPDHLLSTYLNTITFRGHTVSPVMVRVLGMRYPITPDFSVWWVANGEDPVIYHLTDYVQWQAGTVELQLGAPAIPRFVRRTPREFRQLGSVA